MHNGAAKLDFYSNLLQKLQENYNGDDLKLVGAQFGVKDNLFEIKIQDDIRLGVIAIVLVVIIVLIYTNSFFFMFCIAAGLILSIGVSFFVYTIIFDIKFFPFLNLLAMILAVAVGADDAFFFMYHYRKHKREAGKNWALVSNYDLSKTEGKSSDNEELLVKSAVTNTASPYGQLFGKEMELQLLEYHRRRVVTGLTEALSHAAIAMFVTSATTAVAFFANLASKIMVLRCFGIYAGTMMLINYVLVITILPAAIVITDKKTVKSFNVSKSLISKMKSRFSRFWRIAVIGFDSAFSKVIPRIVEIIRIPLIPLALLAFAVSVYAIVKNPGIRLPEKNSMQFLRSNHPYEWFDENSATLFDFSNGEKPKMMVIAIWGIRPSTHPNAKIFYKAIYRDGSSLIPSNIGSLDVDQRFADALANHLPQFQKLLKNLSHQSNPNENANLWLDGFIKWTNHSTTSKGCQMLNANQSLTTHPLTGDMLTRCFLQYGRHSSFAVFDALQLTNADGPIFDKNGAFLGYFLIAQSSYDFSIVFNEMKPFFDFLDDLRIVVKQSDVDEFRQPLILTNEGVTSLYDLLERILNGTAISVLISLVVSTVVIVFTTFHLSLSALSIICIATVVTMTIASVLWFGWTVNVVEATIIVLTIGMSFDYCLHFAVGFRLHGTDDYSAVASAVGVPVLLAAVSSFVAGLALIGASTQAFFEIGVFLILMTAISFFVAVFVFPSMVTCLLKPCSPNRTKTTRL